MHKFKFADNGTALDDMVVQIYGAYKISMSQAQPLEFWKIFRP